MNMGEVGVGPKNNLVYNYMQVYKNIYDYIYNYGHALLRKMWFDLAYKDMLNPREQGHDFKICQQAMPRNLI